MTILTYDRFRSALSWQGAVDALIRGHRLARPQLGDVLLGPDSGLLLNRTAHVPGLGYAVKAETVFPANTGRGLDAIQGRVILFNDETGTPLAVIESRLVTWVKTAADSVLAASFLARPDSRRLLVIGAGVIAASLAEAYASMFPKLERISIWARRPERAVALAQRLADLGPLVDTAGDLEAAIRSADIVSAATFARQPLICGDWVGPGTHIDLVGAFTPEMREADDALMRKGRIHVDLAETTLAIGELAQPMASGAITRDHILGDLYDLVAGRFQTGSNDFTVFKNGGGAHLDLMIARYIADEAEKQGVLPFTTP